MNERDRNVRAQEAHPQHTGTATGRPDDQSYCWNCGLLNTDDAKDCLHCEAPLPGPALMAVMAERNRQDAKWGGPDHDSQLTTLDWHEMIADYNGWARRMATMKSFDKAYRRYIQVAALAVAAAEAMSRVDQHSKQ